MKVDLSFRDKPLVPCPEYGDKPCNLPSCLLMQVCRFKVFTPVKAGHVPRVFIKSKKANDDQA